MNFNKYILYILSLSFVFACNTNNNTSSKQQNLLSDKNATQAAIALYNNMKQLASQAILVGHQDALAYGIGWKDDGFRTDINDVCGDHPAVYGWDLGHIADEVNIDSVSFKNMKQWALAAYKKGGINTYGWHSLNFVTGASSWDVTPCVSNILPGGDRHGDFLKKLNLIADFFEDLKNEKGECIPVLFRPWHEMNGGWFWWGSKSCTPDEYKTLWKFTVDYLRNERQLNNIIYIYSTDVFETEQEYLKYYPGDEYVDVLGYDDYKGLNAKENTHKSVKMIEILADLSATKNKIYTISETGLERIPDSTWFTNVVLPTLKTNHKTQGLSYVLFWRNGRTDHFYAPYPGHSSANDFMEFKNDTLTLFLSGIADIYRVKNN